jgi:hypothetical protein
VEAAREASGSPRGAHTLLKSDTPTPLLLSGAEGLSNDGRGIVLTVRCQVDGRPESLRWLAEGRPWLERLEARIAAYRAGEESPAVPAESPTPDQPALG